MTKQEKELLKQLDSVYNQKRLDEMGRLQNKLVKIITKARLPSQDVLMVLITISRQVEAIFFGNLQLKQEAKQEEKVEKKE